jgi:hypothetical protein
VALPGVPSTITDPRLPAPYAPLLITTNGKCLSFFLSVLDSRFLVLPCFERRILSSYHLSCILRPRNIQALVASKSIIQQRQLQYLTINSCKARAIN